MNAPAVMLADEPTGSLDSQNGHEIINLLKLSNQKYRQTLIVVTHDEKIIPTFNRIYHIRDGQTVEEAGEGRALD